MQCDGCRRWRMTRPETGKQLWALHRQGWASRTPCSGQQARHSAMDAAWGRACEAAGRITFMPVCVSRSSRARLFAIPRTVTHQAPLSKGFSRLEHCSGLPCPPPVTFIEKANRRMAAQGWGRVLGRCCLGGHSYLMFARWAGSGICHTVFWTFLILWDHTHKMVKIANFVLSVLTTIEKHFLKKNVP